MPLYEYKCTACANRFERIVKFSDPPLKTCPKCGKQTIKQLISAPAIQFKGSGWYVTDYAKSGSLPPGNGGGKKDGEGSSEKGSSENGSSEKKDAAKSSDSNTGSSSNSDSSSSSSSNSTPATTAPASSSDKK